VPLEVKDAVGRAIAGSISSYPSLFPDFAAASDGPDSPRSPRSQQRAAWQQRRGSPPPVLPHTSGPKDGSRGPHERDREFLGFITPPYLSLLAGSAQEQASPPLSPPSNSPPTSILQGTPPQSGKDSPKLITESLPTVVRPSPLKRHHTDNTVSSTDSTGSESRVRRSALRRSSSSTKGSPRRVRFRVEGAGEVLPTASPQGSQDQLSRLPKDASNVAVNDDSPLDAAGTSLLDVEGEEDYLPLPKKVSSTEALRAMSRSPLDRGTVWHVVNADPEDLNTLNGIEGNSGSQSASSSTTEMAGGSKETLKAYRHQPSEQPPTTGDAGASAKPEQEERDSEDEDSEEEFLSMGSKGAKKSPSPALQPTARGANSTRAAVSPKASAGKPASPGSVADREPAEENTEEEQEPFVFEGTDLGITPSAKEQDTIRAASAEDSSDEDEAEPEQLSHHFVATARLPIRPVVQAMAAPAVSTPPSKQAAEPSIGSYKGTPLRMGPVYNSKLNEELAQMGAVDTFMGSFHDWDGAASSNPNNFKASLARHRAGGAEATTNFPGTPGSLSERLMLEEVMGGVGDGELEDRLERPPKKALR
jgi:hypothetical protein